MKKRTTRKGLAMLLVGASLMLGSMSASAASWEASHVNQTGVPISASTIAHVIVYHRAAGAKATCNYNSHTNANATTGETRIECVNYTMTKQVIQKTGTADCKPNVGEPTVDVAVSYKVSAITPTAEDIFWSKGNIVKK